MYNAAIMMALIENLLPVINWGSSYNLEKFRADLVAGSIVLFITVPQVVAYAFLAGLPAEAGLYAAVVALLCYAFLGSSKTLAVGPTAIVTMMTLEAASGLAVPGSTDYVETVVQLSLVTGSILILLRLVNFGSVISFLSHAVITGFISAAAILIVGNQLPHLLGLSESSSDTSILGVIQHLGQATTEVNLLVVSIFIATVALLLFCKYRLGPMLGSLGLKTSVVDGLVKSAPNCTPSFWA